MKNHQSCIWWYRSVPVFSRPKEGHAFYSAIIRLWHRDDKLERIYNPSPLPRLGQLPSGVCSVRVNPPPFQNRWCLQDVYDRTGSPTRFSDPRGVSCSFYVEWLKKLWTSEHGKKVKNLPWIASHNCLTNNIQNYKDCITNFIHFQLK